MADKPPFQRLAANENLLDLHTVALAAEGEGLARVVVSEKLESGLGIENLFNQRDTSPRSSKSRGYL